MNETAREEGYRLAAAIRESREQRKLATTYCRQARYQLSFHAHHVATAELAAAMECARLLLRTQAPKQRNV